MVMTSIFGSDLLALLADLGDWVNEQQNAGFSDQEIIGVLEEQVKLLKQDGEKDALHRDLAEDGA